MHFRIFNRNNFNKLLQSKILRSLLHSLVLVLLAVIALNLDYNFAAEEEQVKLLSNLNAIFHTKKDYTGQFVFIDVSGSKALVPRQDEAGNYVITDRMQLATFFTLLNKQPTDYNYIVCDLLFDLPSDNDSILSQQIDATPRVVFPYSRETAGISFPVTKNAQTAYAGYKISSGLQSTPDIVKYQYLPEPGLRTIPLVLYENSRNRAAVVNAGLLWFGSQAWFNNTIFDPRISNENLVDTAGNSKLMPLGDIINLLTHHPELLKTLFKNKTILIGDFENDVHETYAGKMAGPLIISNLFLGLQQEDNKISGWWLLYLLVVCWLLSYLLLYPPERFEKVEACLKKTILGNLLPDLLFCALLVFVASFFSYLIFHKHIDVVLVALYMTGFHFVRERIKNKKKVKRKNKK